MAKRQSGEQVSKDTRQAVHYGLIAVAIGLIITLLAGWYTIGHAVSTIDEVKLGQQISSLESLAAESHILASQYAKGRSPNNFTQISAVQLHQTVSGIADQLAESDIDPDVEKQAQQVSDQADILAESLSQLARLPSADEARQLDRQITDMHEKVGEIL